MPWRSIGHHLLLLLMLMLLLLHHHVVVYIRIHWHGHVHSRGSDWWATRSMHVRSSHLHHLWRHRHIHIHRHWHGHTHATLPNDILSRHHIIYLLILLLLQSEQHLLLFIWILRAHSSALLLFSIWSWSNLIPSLPTRCFTFLLLNSSRVDNDRILILKVITVQPEHTGKVKVYGTYDQEGTTIGNETWEGDGLVGIEVSEDKDEESRNNEDIEHNQVETGYQTDQIHGFRSLFLLGVSPQVVITQKPR